MTRLAWSPSAAITETSAGTVVRSDLGAFHVRGRDAREFVSEVAPLLDGTRDLAAIQRALAGYSPRSVSALVETLSARGLVVEVREGRDSQSSATEGSVFFRPLSKDPEAARAKLASARVVFAGEASFIDAAMKSIRAAGAGDVARVKGAAIEGASLLVAGILPRDSESLFELSKRAHEARVPSLWAHVAGRRVVLGPVVFPGGTACRVCVSTEVLNPVEGLRREEREEKASAGAARLLSDLLVMAAIEVLVGEMPSRLAGRALSQDLGTWESSWRTLVRVPWCRVCG